MASHPRSPLVHGDPLGEAVAPVRSDYDLGREAGRVDAILEAYGEHFKVINGSIERSAQALTTLGTEVRQLREEARLREERGVTEERVRKEAAERAAAELKNRRSGDDRRFTQRERLALLALGTITVILSTVSTIAAFQPFG